MEDVVVLEDVLSEGLNTTPDALDDRKRRSTIYQHFSENKTTAKWKCNYCRKEYAKPAGGGTGSLHNHMNKSHHSKLTPQLQSRLTAHFQKVEATGSKENTQEEFQQNLVKFIVCSNQPFSLVEEPEFKDVIQSVKSSNCNLLLPNRNTMRELIGDAYKSMKEKLMMTMVNNESRINFIIDCWTSANGHSYQGVIASWIDDNWNLQTAVLDLTRINGLHTGDNLAEHFVQVLDGYQITEKFLTLTTDNAANMSTLFMKLDSTAKDRNLNFNSKDYRVRCLAHIINLSCKSILGVLDNGSKSSNQDDSDSENDEDAPSDLISKLRKAVKKIRNSQDKRDWLRKQCQVANIPSNELILDMQVRWNSTLNMIERAMKLRGPLNLTLANFRELHHLQFSIDDWGKLNDLINILKPFKDATLIFSQNKPLLSSTLHIYEILFAHLEGYMAKESASTSYRGPKRVPVDTPVWLQNAATAGWNKLKKYYPSADGLAYEIATVLDPRRKDKWYAAVGWNSEWIKSCRSDVRKLWTSTYKSMGAKDTETLEPPLKRVRNCVEEIIAAQMKSIPRGSHEDELARYLRDPVVDENMDILEWWTNSRNQYPNLSKMARDFLSIFGTGVPVERLFSSATDTLTHRRYRLSPEKINECLCLKSWYQLERGETIHSTLATAITEKILGVQASEEEQC